jgi:hypothetical protein
MESIRRAISNEQARQSLRSSLFNRKVMEWLVGIAEGDNNEAKDQTSEDNTIEEPAAEEEGADPNVN